MLRDLTKGNTFKTLLLFFLPIYFGNLFQKFYSMADSFIVGRTISSDALTGVSATGSINFLVMGLAMGLTAGFAVKTSQYKGAGDAEMVKKSIAVSYELTLLFTIIITAVTVPLTRQILILMATPQQYFDYAYSYLVTIFAGVSATMLYNVTCGSLRAVGDSRAPLVFLIISAVLNIALDLIFIVVFKWTYYGAGLATVISSLLSGVASLIYMFKAHPQLIPERKHWIPDLKMMKGHVLIGLPMSLQYVITAVGCMVQQSELNKLNAIDPGVSTAYAVAIRINDIFEMLFATVGVASATFAAQNYGAKKYGRIRDGITAGVVYMLVGWVVSLAALALLGKPLTIMFIDKNTGDAMLYFDKMLAYSYKYLIVQALCYPFVAIIYLYRNVIQGMGRSAITIVGGVLEFIGRCTASIGLVSIWGFLGTCLSNPLAWLLADFFFLPAYLIIIRKYDTSDAKYSLKNLLRKKAKA